MRHAPHPPSTIEAAFRALPKRPENLAFRDRLARVVLDTTPDDLRRELPLEFQDSLTHLLLFQRQGADFQFRVLGEAVSHLLGRHHVDRLPSCAPSINGKVDPVAPNHPITFADLFAPWPAFAALARLGARWVIDRRREAVFCGVIRYDLGAGANLPFEIIVLPVDAGPIPGEVDNLRLGFGHIALGGPDVTSGKQQ